MNDEVSQMASYIPTLISEPLGFPCMVILFSFTTPSVMTLSRSFWPWWSDDEWIKERAKVGFRLQVRTRRLRPTSLLHMHTSIYFQSLPLIYFNQEISGNKQYLFWKLFPRMCKKLCRCRVSDPVKPTLFFFLAFQALRMKEKLGEVKATFTWSCCKIYFLV